MCIITKNNSSELVFLSQDTGREEGGMGECVCMCVCVGGGANLPRVLSFGQ